MSQHNPNFLDNLAQKADELQIKDKAKDLADATAKLAQTAFEQARGYASENRDKVEGFLDKAAAKVDEQTDGKYHDKVAKARESASSGFQKFADSHGAAGAGGAAAPTVPPQDAPTASTPPAQAPSPTSWEHATDGGNVGDEPSKA